MIENDQNSNMKKCPPPVYVYSGFDKISTLDFGHVYGHDSSCPVKKYAKEAYFSKHTIKYDKKKKKL